MGLVPIEVLQAGFWLSFVAVGVLFATDRGAAAPADTGLSRLAATAFAALREQWVITLALAPQEEEDWGE